MAKKKNTVKSLRQALLQAKTAILNFSPEHILAISYDPSSKATIVKDIPANLESQFMLGEGGEGAKFRKITLINNRNTLGNANDYAAMYTFFIEEGVMKTSYVNILPNTTVDIYFPFTDAQSSNAYEFIVRTNANSSAPEFSDYITVRNSSTAGSTRYSTCRINDLLQELPDEITITVS